MKFKRQLTEEVNVNLTPLIDVVFLLLIFFMVSTTFTKETHLKIDLPQASAEPVDAELLVIDIAITADGQFSVNEQPLVNTQLDTLKRAITQAARNKKELPVMISADAQAPHQAVVTAMDAAGQLGFVELSITTRNPSRESESR
ncbi:biopolymer transporter ExbD [Motiliproteus coralliicola]|uniref:Biopolymer transporter ExbD n=1 Tax=Motiliproteus coralliicola TaxID=2283196 RepID=A0A369WRQ1_9GAMM|nr:biopolymer transporter ExbD [Motiliproteus coralliicola]RDE24780.1 biopolymer transporter ExbD [Motiliproteus coralliicola]